MQIVTIVGARPQFIKAAVVSEALAQTGACEETLIHTGQHYDTNMSGVFFRELGMKPATVNLGIGSGSHGQQTGQMLAAIEQFLRQSPPSMVLVYGDTNSTLAGALAAAKLKVPVAHVEAGLRSFNRKMPEEINRVLTDHASDLLFAPTETAVGNLRREGIDGGAVHQVGDVMYDVALRYGRVAEQRSGILGSLGLASKSYVLVTIHRAENTDDRARLTAIVGGICQIASEIPVVLPVHPRTRKAMSQAVLLGNLEECAQVIPPVGYLDMIMLEKHARLIATDSGGVQKEGYFHQVPVVTVRDETEWTELVEVGWNRLVTPTNGDAVYAAVQDALKAGSPTDHGAQLYGDGHAAERIAEVLGSHLTGAETESIGASSP